jgi:hypothetical protein
MDPTDAEIKKQRDKFIKAFEEIATSATNLVAITKKQMELVNKQIEVTNGLIEAMMTPNDGLRDTIDDLIEEISGLREDMRSFAKAGGLQGVLTLLGPLGRKRT